MNRETLGKVALMIILSTVLAGCGYVNKKLEQNPTTQRQQQCSALKNQLTIPQSAIGIKNQANTNVAQDARAMRLYEQYRCSEFEQRDIPATN